MSMGALPGGSLTSSERAMLGRRFAVIHTDGNGRWQRDDCTLLTQRLCDAFGHTVGSGPGRAVATGQLGLFEVLLRHMDTDGVLDTGELTVAISQFFASRAGPGDRVLRPTG